LPKLNVRFCLDEFRECPGRRANIHSGFGATVICMAEV
jgi:hypothetical protein